MINRAELLDLCAGHGMSAPQVIPGLDYDLGPFLGIPSVEETWVMSIR